MNSPHDLKSAGLKATLPRIKIINLFETTKVRHLTAEDVYKQLLSEGLDIGLATVYRVLTQFEQAGLLVRHHFESGKAVFELNEGKHHDHLVCMQCGRVEEFYDAEIEKRQQRVARSAITDPDSDDRPSPETGRSGQRLDKPDPAGADLGRRRDDHHLQLPQHGPRRVGAGHRVGGQSRVRRERHEVRPEDGGELATSDAAGGAGRGRRGAERDRDIHLQGERRRGGHVPHRRAPGCRRRRSAARPGRVHGGRRPLAENSIRSPSPNVVRV